MSKITAVNVIEDRESLLKDEFLEILKGHLDSKMGEDDEIVTGFISVSIRDKNTKEIRNLTIPLGDPIELLYYIIYIRNVILQDIAKDLPKILLEMHDEEGELNA